MAKKSGKGGGQPLAPIKPAMSLSATERHQLFETLQSRFEDNMARHSALNWGAIAARLEAKPEKMKSLNGMESTGGEPDVIGYDEATGEYIFCDCAAESPGGRRSICYDNAGQAERVKKGVHPAGNALDLAATMGLSLLTEAQYKALQALGEFDTKTSSWIQTPPAIRELGGALFADRRYDHVFVYHNGAQSFYAARGFRGILRV